MVTVVNNPGPGGTNEGSGGWAVAVIVLIAAIVLGAVAWAYFGRGGAPADKNPGVNIDVTLPEGSETPPEGGAQY